MQGRTVFHVAVQASALKCVKLMAEKQRYEHFLQYRDNNGFTLLHYAAEKDNVDIMQALIKNCKEPQYLNYTTGTADHLTPLEIAIDKGHLSIVKSLVEAKATVLPLDAHQKALDFASRKGQTAIVEYLKKGG